METAQIAWGMALTLWLLWPEPETLEEEYAALLEQKRLGIRGCTVAGRVVKSAVYGYKKGQILVAIEGNKVEWLPLEAIDECSFHVQEHAWDAEEAFPK